MYDRRVPRGCGGACSAVLHSSTHSINESAHTRILATTPILCTLFGVESSVVALVLAILPLKLVPDPMLALFCA